MWTLTSSVLCLICARNPCVPSIYGATLASFGIALLHFATELFAFQTLDWKSALQPGVVATISVLWMGAGWNYYTSYAPRAEPTCVGGGERGGGTGRWCARAGAWGPQMHRPGPWICVGRGIGVQIQMQASCRGRQGCPRAGAGALWEGAGLKPPPTVSLLHRAGCRRKSQ